MSEEKDLLISAGHDYDGIKEYDNPLPRWWVYLFYITIVFSCWYMGYYWAKGHIVSVVSKDDENVAWSVAKYKLNEKQAAVVMQEKMKNEPVKSMDEHLGNATSISNGSNLYAANCVACHGAEGQGIVGPNLTDMYWMYGGDAKSIYKSIAEGFPAKGMVAWEPTLGKNKVGELTAFVVSLKGKTVANPKEPQGVKSP